MKTILIFASSINGYIAEADDSTDWSTEEWKTYEQDIQRVQNLIMGKRTYDIMSEGGYLDNLHMKNIVILSHQEFDTKYQTVSSPEGAIEYLESLGENEAIIAGGSDIATQFLEKNLIHEIILDIEPIIISGGIPIFGKLDNIPRINLIDTRKLSENTIRLHYQIL